MCRLGHLPNPTNQLDTHILSVNGVYLSVALNQHGALQLTKPLRSHSLPTTHLPTSPDSTRPAVGALQHPTAAPAAPGVSVEFRCSRGEDPFDSKEVHLTKHGTHTRTASLYERCGSERLRTGGTHELQNSIPQLRQ